MFNVHYKVMLNFFYSERFCILHRLLYCLLYNIAPLTVIKLHRNLEITQQYKIKIKNSPLCTF